MKLRIGLGVIVLSAFGASLAYGAGSVVDSKHNMNVVSAANADIQGRVCAFCHTPHHALDSNEADYNPLWSHTFTTQIFDEYQSPTLQGANDAIDVLAGSSRLCMSCHDGAIAVDQHYSFAGNDLRTGDSWGEIAVAGDRSLTNDHPIGFDYALVGGSSNNTGTTPKAAVAGEDPEIRGTTTPLLADGGRTIADLMLDDGTGAMIMTCGSCHDVHDTYSVDTYFLVGKQDGSQICLTCHIK